MYALWVGGCGQVVVVYATYDTRTYIQSPRTPPTHPPNRIEQANTYLVTRVEMLLREAKSFASFDRRQALAYLGRCVLIGFGWWGSLSLLSLLSLL